MAGGHGMTREEANDILLLWKLGMANYGQTTIDRALRVTGDLLPQDAVRALKRAEFRFSGPSRTEVRVWRSPGAAGNSLP